MFDKNWLYFSLIETAVVRRTLESSLAAATVPYIEVKLTLRRLPEYYVLNIIVPTTVMTILSSCMFFVPAASGEKLSLGITLLLSFSVFLLILSDNTPQTSGPLPMIGKLSFEYPFCSPNSWLSWVHKAYLKARKRALKSSVSKLYTLAWPSRFVWETKIKLSVVICYKWNLVPKYRNLQLIGQQK